MKTLAVFVTLVAVAMAGVALPSRHQTAPFLHSTSNAALPSVPQNTANGAVVVQEKLSDNNGLGGYQFAYQLSDGQSRDESAQFEARGLEEGVIRVQGAYSYVDPADGQTYTIQYVADENGFRPQGAHLPVAPQA